MVGRELTSRQGFRLMAKSTPVLASRHTIRCGLLWEQRPIVSLWIVDTRVCVCVCVCERECVHVCVCEREHPFFMADACRGVWQIQTPLQSWCVKRGCGNMRKSECEREGAEREGERERERARERESNLLFVSHK